MSADDIQLAVAYIRKHMPRGKEFHARELYHRLSRRYDRNFELDTVMHALDACCTRLGGGYFKQ